MEDFYRECNQLCRNFAGQESIIPIFSVLPLVVMEAKSYWFRLALIFVVAVHTFMTSRATKSLKAVDNKEPNDLIRVQKCATDIRSMLLINASLAFYILVASLLQQEFLPKFAWGFFFIYRFLSLVTVSIIGEKVKAATAYTKN